MYDITPILQTTSGSRGVRISGSNAGYTMFRGSVKNTGYPLHSPVSPSLPLQCITVCHHISTGLYQSTLRNIPEERLLHSVVSLTYSRQIDRRQLSRYSDGFRGSNSGRPKKLICSLQRPIHLLDPSNGMFFFPRV